MNRGLAAFAKTELAECGNFLQGESEGTGNMTEAPSPADPTVKHKYVFDAWNRLVKVTDASDVSIQENEFDGLNRRIVKIDKTGASDVTYDYYYNRQWQVLVEADSNDDPICMYAYHSHYVDAPGTRIDADGIKYYLHDANYNVTAVTDNTGTVKERYSYTPYGEVTVLDPNFAADADNKSDIGNEYLYTGRRVDPETYLQLNRNRFYHATFGRWVNRDPIGSRGGVNLYGYVESNPLAILDPLGLTPFFGWEPWFERNLPWFDDTPPPPPSPKPCPCTEPKDQGGNGAASCDKVSYKLCRTVRTTGPKWWSAIIGAVPKTVCDVPAEGQPGTLPLPGVTGCECKFKCFQECVSTGACGQPGEETFVEGGSCGTTRGTVAIDPIGGTICNCPPPTKKCPNLCE